MVRFMSLSSGSCGNCYYLGNEKSGIIIDAGVSLRRLKKVLQEYDMLRKAESGGVQKSHRFTKNV